LLLSLAHVGSELSHGFAHAHGSSDHVSGALSMERAVEDAGHGHAHEHATIDAAAVSRDLPRFDAAQVDALPEYVRPGDTRAGVPERVSQVSLLPRPGPDIGPHGGPRAPPVW